MSLRTTSGIATNDGTNRWIISISKAINAYVKSNTLVKRSKEQLLIVIVLMMCGEPDSVAVRLVISMSIVSVARFET